MSAQLEEYFLEYLGASRKILEAAALDVRFLQTSQQIGQLWLERLLAGNKILVMGNGGSAGDAQHIAAELVSRLNFDRPSLAGLAITTDTSVLTAVGNDYGFERVFERQVRAIGNEGDVLLALSTSGNSPNILRALEAARELGVRTVGMTGASGGGMLPLCELCLRVPSNSTALIQQVYMVAAHAICGWVEMSFFGNPAHKT